MSDDSYNRGVTDTMKALDIKVEEDMNDEKTPEQREDEASDIANEISDLAMELVEDYGWSKQDVLSHIDMVLTDK